MMIDTINFQKYDIAGYNILAIQENRISDSIIEKNQSSNSKLKKYLFIIIVLLIGIISGIIGILLRFLRMRKNIKLEDIIISIIKGMILGTLEGIANSMNHNPQHYRI